VMEVDTNVTPCGIVRRSKDEGRGKGVGRKGVKNANHEQGLAWRTNE